MTFVDDNSPGAPESVDLTDKAARAVGQVSAAAGALFDVSDRIARLVGRVSRGIADSLQAGGRVVAPGIGAAIATLAAPPAGTYEIFVAVSIGAGGLAADSGNAELRYGAAVQAVLAVTSIGSQIFGPFRATLAGATAVSVNATAAGTAAVPYAATIMATRLE